MNHRTRLERLEQRHAGTRWCRCGYGLEHWKEETLEAMETGEPTPGVCVRCGGARPRIEYYDATAEGLSGSPG